MVFIYEIEVTVDHQRRGIGTALIEAIRDIAVTNGMARAFVITTYSKSGAIAFFQHTGAEILDGDDVVLRYAW